MNRAEVSGQPRLCPMPGSDRGGGWGRRRAAGRCPEQFTLPLVATAGHVSPVHPPHSLLREAPQGRAADCTALLSGLQSAPPWPRPRGPPGLPSLVPPGRTAARKVARTSLRTAQRCPQGTRGRTWESHGTTEPTPVTWTPPLSSANPPTHRHAPVRSPRCARCGARFRGQDPALTTLQPAGRGH